MPAFPLPSGLTLGALTYEDHDEVLPFLTEVFHKYGPVHKKFPYKVIEEELMSVCLAKDGSLPQNLSLVLRRSDGHLGAVAINEDYFLGDNMWKRHVTPLGVPAHWKAHNSIFDQLCKDYPVTREGVFHILILAAESNVSGAAKYLMQESLKLAKEKGFSECLIECVNPITSHLCKTYFAGKLLKSIPLSTYNFEGSQPFAEFDFPYEFYLLQCEQGPWSS